ncbi:N-acetylmuramoyl-L-alanine amidase [Paenibacillus pinisoli]|uniref:N-acetylmuramoyl-L-alanine amidase n=1 Tax=Paenibacillus pinisoli TaxID=1276110 RepID=UPI001402F491|nr:N-acetylmuramoyl-L-alanine amidase [Paenibacillus pinisoli]
MRLIGELNPELVIDPGHGGKDPGASGNGIVEKLMTLNISLYQYERFKQLGVKVALTRDSDVTLDSSVRSSLVKNSGAKYCISNHINSAASAVAAGVETIHSIYNDGKLAAALMQAIADAGQPKRSTPVYSKMNASNGDYYFMHRQTGNVSTVIVEYGFCSNPVDAARLLANWKRYAESVMKAYCLFKGHKYSPPVDTSIPPVIPPISQPTPPVQWVEGFSDIAGHWAESSIVKAKQAGIMSGLSEGIFGPEQPMTRAQAAVLLDRLGLLNRNKGGNPEHE